MQVVVIHEGAAFGANWIDGVAGLPWQGPIMDIARHSGHLGRRHVAGHAHRITNLVVGDILVIEGINAGGSYSVAQLVVEGRCRVGRRRHTVAKNIGVANVPT